MRHALVICLVLSASPARAADWEGRWATDTTCEGGFTLTAKRIESTGYSCDFKVEKGLGADDLLVETCLGGGRFLPTFDLVGVHDGKLVVTVATGGPQRTFVRCSGAPAVTAPSSAVPNPFR